MKFRLAVGILVALFALSLCAYADNDSVLYLGQVYCQGVDWCPSFAFWGPDAAGYVELLEPDGKTISDYLWVDARGFLYFESDPLNFTPPPGLPLLGSLIETGQLQEVDQFFPAGQTRPLFIQSEPPQTPEPSTLLLFGSAVGILFGVRRRFWGA